MTYKLDREGFGLVNNNILPTVSTTIHLSKISCTRYNDHKLPPRPMYLTNYQICIIHHVMTKYQTITVLFTRQTQNHRYTGKIMVHCISTIATA